MSTSSNHSRRNRFALVAGSALGLTALTGSTLILLSSGAGAASAGGLTHGTCSKGGTVTMQLQHGDPGRIEAGFEIDHAKVGNRKAAADGTFSVDRILRDLRGVDTLTGRARNLSSGQVCTVIARI
jgi:hypothetical protein